ncbi:MAG: hypothetical protein MAG453_00327 [Calditrichaeota bacterium]|nr:hypothetical protein [Calditrichota bacterium]
MPETSLALICVTAFIAVFVLLALLAVVMELLTRLTPQPAVPTGGMRSAPPSETKAATDDPARVAAIVSAYRRTFPDRKVTYIEQIR